MTEEKDVFQSALDKASELENIEFTDKGIDIEEYYSALTQIAVRNSNFKNEEAENIISNQTKDFVNEEFVKELEEKRKKVEELIRTYDPNKEIVKGMDLSDVDKIYAISNYLLNSYIQYVNEMKFNVSLTMDEYKFLNKALTREIEYDADEVFNYVELMNNLWYGVQKTAEENRSGNEVNFVSDIKMILILHHLIKNYKVKGYTHDFNLFKNVLYKIATFNKLFNAYSIVIERMKQDREVWGSAIDHVANEKEKEKENNKVSVE